MIEATTADKSAALALLSSQDENFYDVAVQAFARHRIASAEAGARLALERASATALAWRDENKIASASEMKRGNIAFAQELTTAATECHALSFEISKLSALDIVTVFPEP